MPPQKKCGQKARRIQVCGKLLKNRIPTLASDEPLDPRAAPWWRSRGSRGTAGSYWTRTPPPPPRAGCLRMRGEDIEGTQKKIKYNSYRSTKQLNRCSKVSSLKGTRRSTRPSPISPTYNPLSCKSTSQILDLGPTSQGNFLC